MRRPFRVAAVLTWAALAALGGCAAIAGLDGITEQACAPNCDGGAAADGIAAPPADGASPGSDVAVSDDSTTGPDTTTGNDTGAGDDQTGVDSPVTGDGGDSAAPDAGDDGADAGHDAEVDTGTDAGVDTGCGPLTTVTNCTACGTACVANNASAPACNGTTCSYTCNANFLDCNKGVAPDPDGCECNAPGATQAQCCANTCPIAHDYDLDLAPAVGTFYDCVAAGTYNGTVAMDACIAFTGNAALCTSGYYCPQFPDGGGTNLGDQVCSDKAAKCQCWAYDGSLVGLVSISTTTTCYCPITSGPHWN